MECLYVKWNVLIVGLIKKTLYKMSLYFPKPYKSFGGNIKIELDLSSYPTKAKLKSATGVDTSKLATKADLASLKAEVDKIDANKLFDKSVVNHLKYQ